MSIKREGVNLSDSIVYNNLVYYCLKTIDIKCNIIRIVSILEE